MRKKSERGYARKKERQEKKQWQAREFHRRRKKLGEVFIRL